MIKNSIWILLSSRCAAWMETKCWLIIKTTHSDQSKIHMWIVMSSWKCVYLHKLGRVLCGRHIHFKAKPAEVERQLDDRLVIHLFGVPCECLCDLDYRKLQEAVVFLIIRMAHLFCHVNMWICFLVAQSIQMMLMSLSLLITTLLCIYSVVNILRQDVT